MIATREGRTTNPRRGNCLLYMIEHCAFMCFSFVNYKWGRGGWSNVGLSLHFVWSRVSYLQSECRPKR